MTTARRGTLCPPHVSSPALPSPFSPLQADSVADVLLYVLDARDPFGTRCLAVEEYLRKEAPHEHLIFVLNKASLRYGTAYVVQLS